MKSKILNNSIIIFFVLLLTSFTPQKDFLSEQKTFERVRKAIDEKGNIIANNLKSRTSNRQFQSSSCCI